MDVSEEGADNLEKGQQLLKQGKPEEAIKEFDTAISIRPDSESAYRGRAKAFRKLGERRRAAASTDIANRLAKTRRKGVIGGAHAASLLILGVFLILFAFPMGVYAAELYERSFGTALRLIILASVVGTAGIVFVFLGFFRFLKRLILR